MIRCATFADLDQIWQLRLETTELLKKRGIDQWQHQNPTYETFKRDIEGGEFYVMEHQGEVIAMIAIKHGIEKTYNIIYDGAWGYDHPYLTIHRLAVKKEYLGQNIARELLQFADQLAISSHTNYIRIDTYMTNKYAIRLFESEGYILRGWIMLEPGEGDLRRLAFDKWVEVEK
ncbi:MAG TPA: GNAT family N-acetyltransferase [Acholeplasmataceae bacterium]|nr:GNAT family N-acetyltransferase [Acholeplasmataceae bacterium]